MLGRIWTINGKKPSKVSIFTELKLLVKKEKVSLQKVVTDQN